MLVPEFPSNVYPYRIPGKLGVTLGFIGSIVLIVLIFGLVLRFFHDNPAALAVTLAVVLVAALAIAYVFVKLVLNSTFSQNDCTV